LRADIPWDDILTGIAQALFAGDMVAGTIDPNLYRETAQLLLAALLEGMGGPTGYEDPRNGLAAYLQQNIYAFSAAKTLTQLQHFRDLLAGAKNLTTFRNSVIQAGYVFNKTWLETEGNTATASAQMAVQWEQFETNGTEYLEYTTVGDDRVRPAHAILDGFTALRTSSVWNTLYPPLAFNCRCHVVPGVKGGVGQVEQRLKLDQEQLIQAAQVMPLFQNNSGITKVVYNNQHPYFQDNNGFMSQLAAANYGMPSVRRLYEKYDFPPVQVFTKPEAAGQWWQRQVGPDGAHLDLKDPTALSIRVTRGDNTPHSFIANLPALVQHPDEVWTMRSGDTLTRSYIKYYENGPLVLQASTKDGNLTAKPVKQLGIKDAEKLRRGNLVLRKN
jgi:SPP1 gp7 family putative phage head morphogenesis protein